MAAKGICFRLSTLVLLKTKHKPCFSVSVGTVKLSNRWCANTRVGRICSCGHNGKTKETVEVEEELKPLWDDGYGAQTVKDYLEAAKDMIKTDDGPPRWFCPVESGPPLKNSPLLLYLPGIDGSGMGMILHHKALGKVFEVRCMHIPVSDRTPYERLVKFVEKEVRAENESVPNRPIYLVGDSFGGCLALSVAASNPMLDLVLILVNPATSFNKSQHQLLLPFLEAFPQELHGILPYLVSITLGDPIKMAKVISTSKLLTSPSKQLKQLIHELSVLITGVSSLSDIFSKQTLIWKLKLLKSAAAFANSRLHAVKSEVLILASGNDSVLPSQSEALRLSGLLMNSLVRFFKNNGHTLLLEDGVNLLTILKGTFKYRRSKRRDYVTDFLPPSLSEFHNAFDEKLGLFRVATSPVMFSTLSDGTIVRGLKGIPDHGPVLLVGYHMLLGSEVGSIVEEFLKEKNVMVHGITHPEVFSKNMEESLQPMSGFDYFKIFGAIPVSANNLLRLLSKKSYVLLFPGGVREALHRKGEQYKLFWPEEPEFVRMATKYGAKIVPFGVVGIDDLLELFLDYNDLMKVPHFKEDIKLRNEKAARVRAGSEVKGEISNQDFFIPGVYPKLPGRFYFLFGKPMETKGKEEMLKNKIMAMEFYLEVKAEVERSIAYLMKKREEDPYRFLFDRLLYRAISAPANQVPTFEP